MKVTYYSDTDSLYIELSEEPGADSLEISEGVVLDYDAQGNITGIDIDNAAHKVQLREFFLSGLPMDRIAHSPYPLTPCPTAV